MPAAFSGSSASRWSRPGSSPCCSRRYLGYKLLPSITRQPATARRHAIYATRILPRVPPRAGILRRAAARRHRRWRSPRVRAVGLSQFGKVQQQFFPLSERPELFFELRLAEGSAIEATEKVAREAEKLIAGDDGRVELYDLYRQGLAAVLARPAAGAAERILRADRDRRQGRRGARADQGADRERPSPTAR